MRWAGLVACKGDRRGVYSVLVGKLEGKRPLGRPRWKNNIKMGLQKWDVRTWAGSSWLSIGTAGGHL